MSNYKYKCSEKIKQDIKFLIQSFCIDDDEVYDTEAFELYRDLLRKVEEIDMYIDKIKYIIEKENGIVISIKQELEESIENASKIMDSITDTEEIEV